MNDFKSDEELLSQLGVSPEDIRNKSTDTREARCVDGFLEISNFIQVHGRPPTVSSVADIQEKILATRLEAIRSDMELVEMLRPYDVNQMLPFTAANAEDVSDETLLTSLGIDTVAPEKESLTNLRFVKPRSSITMPPEIGSTVKCAEFDIYEPVLKNLVEDLREGRRESIPFAGDASISEGNAFILDGQLAIIAEVGPSFIVSGRHKDAHVRVIYDNGTEGNIRLRSFQRALNKDPHGRRLTDKGYGPLFDEQEAVEDQYSGTIYVCRSLSEDPFISENRDLVHKIGVTKTNVNKRIANADIDPTFLMAEVQLIETFDLFGLQRNKVESMIHKVFSDARLEIKIQDRFGRIVQPKEWFCVPISIIREVMEKIHAGSISNFYFSLKEMRLLPHPEK
jgi:hypothetical protein